MVDVLHRDKEEEEMMKKKKERVKQQVSLLLQSTKTAARSTTSSMAAAPGVDIAREQKKQQDKKKKKKKQKKKRRRMEQKNLKEQEAVDLLCLDSVKSRNRHLVLDPLTSGPSASISCGVSTNCPTWGAKPTQNQVRLKPMLQANQTVTDALHDEIIEYTMDTKIMVEKMAVHIEEMIANVRASVLSIWPQSKVETFGSYATGIWLPSSDVDLVILDVVAVNDAKLTATHLKALANLLEKKTWVESLLVLETAKVPVLKLVSAGTSVPIDITFESAATHSGLLARDLIKRCADSMPELYPLAILFKQLLRERDLNDAYTGGLSSYSVVLMLIHFAQLWRNGDACFEAASIYASGSLPPIQTMLAPKNQAVKAGQIWADLTSMNGRSKASSECNVIEASTGSAQRSGTATAGAKSSPNTLVLMALPPPTSTYASIVARTKQQPSGDSCRNTSSEPRLSYAAVAAGTAKVSKEKKLTGPPSSYAAAVSAPAGSSSSAERNSVMKAKKQEQDAHLLDAISVSSSNADTEDSSSLRSHSSATDSDDESAKMLSHQPPVSLGEHTMMILEFFGIIFDYRKNGLSVRDGGYIYRLADSHDSLVGKPALVIEDPIHPDRNVSASSFAFSKVVALFEDSYYALKYFRVSKFTPSALSCLLSTAGHTSCMNHSDCKVQAVRL